MKKVFIMYKNSIQETTKKGNILINIIYLLIIYSLLMVEK